MAPGGGHDKTGSLDYMMWRDRYPHSFSQCFRWCYKCDTMYDTSLGEKMYSAGMCPGAHDKNKGHSPSKSPIYAMFIGTSLLVILLRSPFMCPGA
jgi:hypothetical protein